jgi:hypothetical protein
MAIVEGAVAGERVGRYDIAEELRFASIEADEVRRHDE